MIRLRSFRPPANWCPHCGQLRNPDAIRENIGCLAFAPIAIGVAAGLGYAAFFVGELLAPALNVPDLAPRSAFLAGIDGFALVVLVYWRTVGGANAAKALAPFAVFGTFLLLGMKCGRGLGIEVSAVWGLANGLLGFLLAHPLLPRPQ